MDLERRIGRRITAIDIAAAEKNRISQKAESVIGSFVKIGRLNPSQGSILTHAVCEAIVASKSSLSTNIVAAAGRGFNTTLEDVIGEKPGLARNFVEELSKIEGADWKDWPAEEK